MKMLKWLYPGMKVKRWIFMSAVGIIFVVSGTIRGVKDYDLGQNFLFAGLLILIGIILMIIGSKQMTKTFIMLFAPMYREDDLVDLAYKKRQLSKGPKIVVIGGGTGLSVLLHGLKAYTSNLTAIVTVADDGGSSGRLRKQFNILPPGDIRNCLVALADTEPMMQDLFQFRFPEGTELAGHNFGNLFITAMTKIAGDFENAIKESSKVLAISGQVIPATLKRVTLVAAHVDGTKTYGETKISKSTSPISRVNLMPEGCLPTEAALDAINAAELIVLGPGSLYTSVLPNLIINNMAETIKATKAKKLYVCNVMTQSGETDNFSAYDHIKAIQDHISCKFIDYCIINTGIIPDEFRVKYQKEGAIPVVADDEKIKAAGISVIADNVISTKDHVRHNSEKLAENIMALIEDLKSTSSSYL